MIRIAALRRANFALRWQSYAGLLPGEGACVTFYALRPLERGGHGAGRFLDFARNDGGFARQSDSQISDFRQAMRLEPFHPLVADHMMAGVSLAALEITVALCRTIRWSDYNEKI